MSGYCFYMLYVYIYIDTYRLTNLHTVCRLPYLFSLVVLVLSCYVCFCVSTLGAKFLVCDHILGQ